MHYKTQTKMIGATTSTVIKVNISVDELQAFRQFQRILPDVTTMLEHKVFDFRGGSVVIHRDADGKLALIVPNWPTYRKGS